jgi:hypothetical protein
LTEERKNFSESLDTISAAAVMYKVERLHSDIAQLHSDLDKRLDELGRAREKRDEQIDRRFDQIADRVQALYDRLNLGKGAAWFIGVIAGAVGIFIAIWDRWK